MTLRDPSADALERALVVLAALHVVRGIGVHVCDGRFIERIGLLPFTLYRLLIAALIVWHFA